MTTKQISENRNIPEKLVAAVIRQIGGKENFENYAEDVSNHGADAGFCGFTYYSDTVPFFKRNRASILELVQSMADDLGEIPTEMVAGFQCLGGSNVYGRPRTGGNFADPERERRKALNEYLPSVSRCLYGGRLTEEDTQVANALAWFALEEVCRAYSDMKETA